MLGCNVFYYFFCNSDTANVIVKCNNFGIDFFVRYYIKIIHIFKRIVEHNHIGFCILHFLFVLFCDVLCQFFVLDYRAAFYIFVKHNNDVAAHNKFREHKVKVVVISGVGNAIVPCIVYAVKNDVCIFDFIIGIFGVVVKFFEFLVFASVVNYAVYLFFVKAEI